MSEQPAPVTGPPRRVRVTLEWQPIGSAPWPIDLDLTAFVCTSEAVVDAVGYHRPMSADTALHHSGDDTGHHPGAAREEIVVDGLRTAPGVLGVVIAVTSYTGVPFTEVPHAVIRVLDVESGAQLAAYSMAGAGQAAGMVVGTLSRVGDGWDFVAQGRPVDARHPGQLLTALADGVALPATVAPAVASAGWEKTSAGPVGAAAAQAGRGRAWVPLVIAAIGVVTAAVFLGFILLPGGLRAAGRATPAPPVTSATTTDSAVATAVPSAAPSSLPAPSALRTPGVSGSSPVVPSDPSAEDDTALNAYAEAVLTDQRRVDRTLVDLDGQWSAMLASKYDGVKDPLQTTASGSPVFRSADIMAAHYRLRDTIQTDTGIPVVLARSTDFGKAVTVDGKPLWVTLAVGEWSSADEVRSWCAGAFPDLSSDQLANQCVPARLTRP